MSARLSVYFPDLPTRVIWVEPGATVRIGRAPECEVRIQDGSVSRLHAELSHSDGAWRLRDLASKNGTLLAGEAHPEGPLPERAELLFGHVGCRFEACADDAREQAVRRAGQRQAAATLAAHALGRLGELREVLRDTLAGAMQLVDCDRGFLLLREGERWRVRASRGVEPEAMRNSQFAGRAGAVQRALTGRRRVLVNRIAGAEPSLAQPGAFATGSPHALLAQPIQESDRLLALLYLEHWRVPASFCDEDLELVQDYASRAALWIAARSSAAALSQLPSQDPDWRQLTRQHDAPRPAPSDAEQAPS